jgi:hypothetical protein
VFKRGVVVQAAVIGGLFLVLAVHKGGSPPATSITVVTPDRFRPAPPIKHLHNQNCHVCTSVPKFVLLRSTNTRN